MERVFYFSGYRMTVFDWDGKHLFGSRDFQPDEYGFQDFEKLLKSSVKSPTRLLVDMIEEDLRRETIPHVNVFDRRALIKRLLERHYRDEAYVHARMIGRTQTGRRDDQVLLSALTNTGLLTPWLERFEKYEIQLAGIWSLPMLAEKLIKPTHATEEHVLIVSRQVRSALRNCYLHKGRLMISRQSKFDKDMWDNNNFAGVIANLERSTTELYNFLLNQRLVGDTDNLKVYCLVNGNQIDEARTLIKSKEHIEYEFVSLEDVFKYFGLKGCEQSGSDALYSYLCTNKNPLYDHYAKEEQKTTYYKNLVERIVRNTTEIGSLLFVTLAVLLTLKGMELDLQQQNVSRAIDQMQFDSNARFGDIQNELNSATYIEDSVNLVSHIARDANQAPHAYFGALSEVLSKPEFKPIQLLEMDWQKYPRSEAQQIIKDHQSRLAVEDPNTSEEYSEDYVEEEGSLITRQSILTLKGSIHTNGLTYRQTIDTMNLFVSELRAMDKIDEVLLIKTAADIRETSRFTDQLRGEQRREIASDLFEVLVVVGAEKSV